MTIPTRPAPAPPGSLGQNAAAGANASLERLRLQLQQQHQEQQQQNGLLVKLPPPPKGPLTNNNNNSNSTSSSTSITRKFPPARYSPALTSWDDAPFQVTKKVPPPRPPPPRVTVSSSSTRTKATTVQSTTNGGGNLLSNIFQRKKIIKSNSATNASRVYNVSSGKYGATTNSTLSKTNSTNGSYTTTTTATENSFTNNWNSNWSPTTTNNNNNIGFTITLPSHLSTASGINSHQQTTAAEAQLISFDSPPSSPTFTQKSNSDCVSVDSFSSDSNFSSPNNGSVSQPESGFEDDFSAIQQRSRPTTTSPLDPWESGLDTFNAPSIYGNTTSTLIGTAPVRNLNNLNQRNSDNPLCNGKNLLPPTPSLTAPTIIKPKISQKPKAPKPPMFLRQNFDLTTPPSPPMPQCPPPPAPTTNGSSSHGSGISLLDVISGKVDAIHLGGASHGYEEETIQQSYGIALYDFNGVEEGDLCFKENEKIYIIEQVSAEWYLGRTRAGCEGIFPSNYIEIKVPLNVNATTKTTTTTKTSATTKQINEKSLLRVKCLYNFPAEVQGDLALKEDEFVTILYQINEDWIFGETDDRRQGQFPANFLEYLPDNIPSLP